jgi:hypothetical protein
VEEVDILKKKQKRYRPVPKLPEQVPAPMGGRLVTFDTWVGRALSSSCYLQGTSPFISFFLFLYFGSQSRRYVRST